jgi:RNA polymerase sigma factor (sigma-70 family)
MNRMPTDAEMLRRYVRERDHHAFAELVQRHLGVVYGAALRRSGGRTHLAEEIAQQVFADLARKAAALCHHPSLIGWLHRSTRYALIDAIRAENRQKKLTETFAAMPDTNPPVEEVEWGLVRPVLDDALDRLKEADREAMLLRYFEGLAFSELGERLNISENAARMRTDRALDKLRVHLRHRGITSTTAALAVLLANQAFAAAPSGLTTAVTATALAGAPATGGFTAFLLMTKLTIPVGSAMVAAGTVAFVWTVLVPGVSARELSALRSENARLVAATGPAGSAKSLAAIADEYARQAATIAQAMTSRQTGTGTAAAVNGPVDSAGMSAVTPRGHRDRGTATARDAAFTFAWACDVGDPGAIARVLYFDADARAKAGEILASMPPEVRAQYPTVEDFYGLLLAISTMEAPGPGADIMETEMTVTETGPNRVKIGEKDNSRFFHEYQLTTSGWKYVLPLSGVNGLPSLISSETVARLTQPSGR